MNKNTIIGISMFFILTVSAIALTLPEKEDLTQNLNKLDQTKYAKLAKEYAQQIDFTKPLSKEDDIIIDKYLQKNIRSDRDTANKYFQAVSANKITFEEDSTSGIIWDGTNLKLKDAAINPKTLPTQIERISVKKDAFAITLKPEEVEHELGKRLVTIKLTKGTLTEKNNQLETPSEALYSITGGDISINNIHHSPGAGTITYQNKNTWKLENPPNTPQINEATLEIPGNHIGLNPDLTIGIAPLQTTLIFSTEDIKIKNTQKSLFINQKNFYINNDASIYLYQPTSDWSFANYHFDNQQEGILDKQNIEYPKNKQIPKTKIQLHYTKNNKPITFDIDKEATTLGIHIGPLQQPPVPEISPTQAKQREKEGIGIRPMNLRTTQKSVQNTKTPTSTSESSKEIEFFRIIKPIPRSKLWFSATPARVKKDLNKIITAASKAIPQNDPTKELDLEFRTKYKEQLVNWATQNLVIGEDNIIVGKTHDNQVILVVNNKPNTFSFPIKYKPIIKKYLEHVNK